MAHLYIGLFIGAVVMIIGVSGSILVFAPEMKDRANAALKFVEPGPQRLSMDVLAQAVQRAYPSAQTTGILFAAKPNGSVSFLMRSAEPKTFFSVFVDPFRGAILGKRGGIAKRTSLDWISDLHHNLLAGKTGLKINGAFAVLLDVMCMTGLYLWWPGRKWSFRLTGNWKSTNFVLHNALGFWSATLLVLIATTGLIFCFPLAKPVSVPPPRAHLQAGKAAIEDYLQAANRELPGGKPTSLVFPYKPGDPVAVRIKLPGDLQKVGSNFVYMDLDATILGVQRHGDLAPARRVLDNFPPLHFGDFGGLPLKLIWCAAGVAPGVLFVSGVILWWTRKSVPGQMRQ
ncbi:MAG TPA: PepSY-associated TM helix domain-containing protein [Bryobacteraceae bacterium]|nr:PepSY-associated TM helix domain-containing protein [Bryobacteraceae bacterium]